MNQPSSFTSTYDPKRFYGALIVIALLAGVAAVAGYDMASADQTIKLSNAVPQAIEAGAYRLLHLVPLYGIFFFAITGMLGLRTATVLHMMRQHNNNDSVQILLNYLITASAFVVVSINLGITWGAFLVFLFVKLAVMLAFGTFISILMNFPYFGVNAKEFVDHICNSGSDAVARNTGTAFLVAAVITVIFI